MHTVQYRVTGYIKEYRVYIGQEVRQTNLCLKRVEMYKLSEIEETVRESNTVLIIVDSSRDIQRKQSQK